MTTIIDFVQYNYFGSTAYVSGFSGQPQNWNPVIPSSITVDIFTYSVISIGNNAFNECTDLESIVLPSTITSIGSNTFQDCSALSNINFPSSITSILGYAFYHCILLTSVNLSSTSITKIESNTFNGCSALTTVAFPNTIQYFEPYSFFQCISLTNIDISGCSSFNNIGGQCFYGCNNLTSVIFHPTNLIYISDNVFYSCISLASIGPLNFFYIGGYAFSGCISLTSVDFSSSTFNDLSIGVFNSCTNLSSVILPTLLGVIRDRVFNGCQALSSIVLPDYISNISAEAFQGCSALTTINIPSSVNFIGARAFESCSALTSLNLSSTLINGIYTSTCGGCLSLSNVQFPPSVTLIGDNCFQGCSSLTNITFPDILANIGNASFQSSALTSVIIPASVTSIGVYAFFDCLDLDSVTFNTNPLPTIGNNAFTDIKSPSTAYYSYGTNTSSISSYFDYLVPFNVPCFLTGSKILTDQGYLPVEEVKKGDLVKTLNHGFLPIELIGKGSIYNSGKDERIKDRLYRCSKDQYPELTEDLVLTGCHSLLVNNFANEEERKKTIEVNGDTYVTDQKYRLPACADERAKPYEKEGTFTIYHIALENDNYFTNYGIYANGLLVETCSKRYLTELSNMTLL